MSEYSFHVDSTDLSVAFDCEADRAKSEGFANVEQRQRENALHVKSAFNHMKNTCPEGHRVVVKIVFTHVPAVEPVAWIHARFPRKVGKQ